MHIRKNRKHKGFTLIEILVVLAIIATLAGIGFAVFSGMLGSSAEKETEVRINAVDSSMDSRSGNITKDQKTSLTLDVTKPYPEADGGANSSKIIVRFLSGDFDGDGQVDDNATPEMTELVLNNEGASGTYINAEGQLIDSWGSEIRYRFPGIYQNGVDGFDLTSPGPDREYDTEDDIKLK